MLQIRDDGGLPDHAFTEGFLSTPVVADQLDADIAYAYLLGRALPDNDPALQAQSSQLRPTAMRCDEMWLGVPPRLGPASAPLRCLFSAPTVSPVFRTLYIITQVSP